MTDIEAATKTANCENLEKVICTGNLEETFLV